MKRIDHTFEFKAGDIAAAARERVNHHRERLLYWEAELDRSIATVKETASIVVREFDVTGGKRVDLAIDFGDGAARRRMEEAQRKIEQHRADAERFEAEALLYGSQDRARRYELDADDVRALRLLEPPATQEADESAVTF